MDNFNQQGSGTRQPQNSNGQQLNNRPNMNRTQGQPMSNRPNNIGNVQQRPVQNPNQQYGQRPQQGQNRQQPQQRPVQQQQQQQQQGRPMQQQQPQNRQPQQQYGQPQQQQQQAFNQQNNNYGNMNQNQNFQQQPQQNNQYQFSDNVEAPNDKLGKISLILGILSLFCCGIFTGIPALIVSGKARKQNPYDKKAKAGKVLGIINIVLTVIATIVMIILVLTGKADFHTSVTGFDGVEHNYEYDAESGSMMPQDDDSSDNLSNIEYDSSVNNETTYETESTNETEENNGSLFTAPESNTTTNEAPERPETVVNDSTLNESTPVEENTSEVTVYESNDDIIAATGVNFESVTLSGVVLPVDNSITMRDLATYTGINFGTTLDEELEGLSYNYVSFTTNNYDTLIFYACNSSNEVKKIGDCTFFGVSLNCNSSKSLADWVEFNISNIITQDTTKDYFTDTFGVSDEITTDEDGTELYEYHTAFKDHKNLEVKYNADGKMTGFTIQNFPEELF